ncbi:MAG: efflux RND transporter periplasmic adaptor subunit [Sulfuritalea sp.]|nr:efflux RND transporter periplasmic adaptor subunit [Sulfuritalea sp.]
MLVGNLPAALAADLPPPKPPAVAPLAPPRLPMAVQSGNAGKKLGDDMECLLEPHLVANVGSPVEGTLNQILADRGAAVSKGQVVARLNASVETANLELRRAQEEFGKRKVARNKELFSKELISANEKDEIETQTRIAGLEVRQQEQVVDQRSIRSPLNGVVVERYLGPGERVANEKAILRIAQIDPLNVEVIAPVELFGSVKPGMSAEVRLDPLLSGVYKARVVVVDRLIDAASGTFGIRLELPNPGNKVPAGIKCKARLKAG